MDGGLQIIGEESASIQPQVDAGSRELETLPYRADGPHWLCFVCVVVVNRACSRTNTNYYYRVGDMWALPTMNRAPERYNSRRTHHWVVVRVAHGSCFR